MLSVYYGSDRKQVVDSANKAASLIASEVLHIDEQSYAPGQFLELTSAVSLFGAEQVYVIDTPSSDEDFSAACIESINDMANSSNHFFIVENTLLAPIKKKFAKHADKIEEFNADKPERFNTFSMADALARRDKKSLWLMAQEANLVGIQAEEIIGILWWQLKTMRLASLTKSAAEAGVKDYPYNKAKKSLSKYTPEEINDLSRSLLSLYHEGHKGLRDIKLALEKWTLQI